MSITRPRSFRLDDDVVAHISQLGKRLKKNNTEVIEAAVRAMAARHSNDINPAEQLRVIAEEVKAISTSLGGA